MALAESLASTQIQPSSTGPSTILDVHSPDPIESLLDQYRRGRAADLYEAKLGKHGLARLYRSVRRVRGEGNCFYRSFWTGWIERMLVGMRGVSTAANHTHAPAANHPLIYDPREHAWQESIHSLSKIASDRLPEPQKGAVLRLGHTFIERTRGLCSAALFGGERAFLEGARRNAETLEVLAWLRLLASSYLREHEADFEPVALVGGYASVAEFCVAQVETDETLADDPQITALTGVLGLGVRVEYLVDTATEWSSRCGPHSHILRMPHEEPTAASVPPGRATSPPLVACLLFRPGHYDLLVPRDWSDPELLEPDRDAFVPPLPPIRPLEGQRCEYCREPKPLRACWLCAAPVCTNTTCMAALNAAKAAPRDAVPCEGNLYSLPASFRAEEPEGRAAAVCSKCIMRCPKVDLNAPEEMRPKPPRIDTDVLWRCAGCEQLGFPSEQHEHQRTCPFAQRLPPSSSTAGAAALPTPTPPPSAAAVPSSSAAPSPQTRATLDVTAAPAAPKQDETLPLEVANRREALARAAEVRAAEARTRAADAKSGMASEAAASTSSEARVPGEAKPDPHALQQHPLPPGVLPAAQHRVAPPPAAEPPAPSAHLEDDDDAEMLLLIEQAKSNPVVYDAITDVLNVPANVALGRLSQVGVLKRRANELAIVEPDGDVTRKATWLRAILTYHEVYAVAQQVDAAAAREREAEEAARAEAAAVEQDFKRDVAILQQYGYTHDDAETAMKANDNDFSRAHAMLMHARRDAEMVETNIRAERDRIIDGLERQGYRLADVIEAVDRVGNDYLRASDYLIAKERRQRELRQGTSAEQPQNIVQQAVQAVTDPIERGWQAATQAVTQAFTGEQAAASSQPSLETIEAQERQSEQKVDELLRGEGPRQAAERWEYLTEQLRIPGYYVDLAARAQATLHPGMVAQTEQEAEDALWEAIGLTVEARESPDEVDCIAKNALPRAPIQVCPECRRGFYTYAAWWNHRRASNWSERACKDWRQMGKEDAEQHHRGTQTRQYHLPPVYGGAYNSSTHARGSTSKSRTTTLQQPPMKF